MDIWTIEEMLTAKAIRNPFLDSFNVAELILEAENEKEFSELLRKNFCIALDQARRLHNARILGDD